MKKLLWKNIWQTVAAAIFLLAVWIVAYYIVGNELLFPRFSDVFFRAWDLLGENGFWTGLGMSLLRALCAFALSFVAGAFFAVISYLYPSFCSFLAPIVSGLRSLPILAVLLILLSFFGAGEAPIAVGFLALFPMLYTGILTALSGIDRQLIEISKVYGAPLTRRVFGIYLPISSPYILREAGGALSYSLKLIVSAEVLANTAKSLGGMMQEAKLYAEIPQLFALVGVTFLVGLALELSVNLLAQAVEKKVK